MSPPPRTTHHPPEDTRERLLVAARDAYLEVGLAGFSLRDVARQVGISAPAVYRHFAGRDELLRAVCEQGFQIFSGYLLRALRETTPDRRLRAARDQYLRFGLEHPRDYRFVFMSSTEDLPPPDAAQGGGVRNAPTFQFLVDRVAECMKAGSIAGRDAEEVAVVIWSHLHGLVSLRLSGHLAAVGDDEAFTTFFRKATDRFLDGLAR